LNFASAAVSSICRESQYNAASNFIEEITMRRHLTWRMLARFSALALAILVLIAASAKITASTHADARSRGINQNQWQTDQSSHE
jgi:hypothetical protein